MKSAIENSECPNAAVTAPAHRLVERACPICDSNESRIWRAGSLGDSVDPAEASELFRCTSEVHGRFFPIRECLQDNCRTKFSSPCPDEASLGALYTAVEDTTYTEHEGARRIAARETLKLLPKTGGRLLEIGSYTGVFLDEARSKGFECFGIEPSKMASERARARGLEVVQGVFPCTLPWDFQFDVIVLWDVIEHVWHPTSFIRELAQHLRPNGELHFTTIRVDCLIARLLGSRWPWYMPMHLTYFEERSLQRMISAAGLREPAIRSNFHYADLDYVVKKLRHMRFPLNALGGILSFLPSLRLKISLGDTCYVQARR